MSAWIRKLVTAPVFEDEEKTRAAALLNAILLILLVADLALTPITVAMSSIPASARFNLLLGSVGAVMFLGLLLLTRRGYVRIAGAVCSSLLLIMITAEIYAFNGIRNTTTAAYLVVIAIAALLLGGRAALVFGLLSVLATLGVYYAQVNGAITVPVSVNLSEWFLLAVVLAIGAFLLRYAVRSIAEGFERARRHAQDLAEINRELVSSRDMLRAQTRDLMRRTRYLEAAAAVARDATSVLDMQELLARVVMLISEQFGFYHTGIFLLDATGEWAELRAASSEGGHRMLARGHRLRVGEQGIVGYVTGHGEPRIALDVGKDAVYFDNPDLPETRSEIALPLRARGKILGALDVQSTEPEAFTEEDMGVLQTLADQVAMAVSNAQLFAESQAALEMERRAYGEIGREAWRELLRAQADRGYLYAGASIVPAVEGWSPTMLQAARTGRSVTEDGTGTSALAVPIKIRDQVIGVLNVRKSKADETWRADEIGLLEMLADQLGVALESARLFQEAQHRAARERLTGEVVDQMRRAVDIDALLQTALHELTAVTGASSAFVQLAPLPEAAGDGGRESADR